jgi:hypothetical protein
MTDMFSAWEVAWYAAIVATLTLLFNVWKYSRERARLRVQIVPTVYHDGGISRTEKTEHGEISYQIAYYHIEIVNVGERPTTIMGVSATTEVSGIIERLRPPWPRKRAMVGLVGSVFVPHDVKLLPHVLDPGGVWSCRVPVDLINQLRRNGIPNVKITATYRRRPKLVRFPTRRVDPEW